MRERERNYMILTFLKFSFCRVKYKEFTLKILYNIIHVVSHIKLITILKKKKKQKNRTYLS